MKISQDDIPNEIFSEESHDSSYELNKNCLQRRLLFQNAFNIFQIIHGTNGHPLKTENLPNPKQGDDCESLAWEIKQKINLKLNEEQKTERTSQDLFDSIYEVGKGRIKFIGLMISINGIFKILSTVMFNILISTVLDLNSTFQMKYFLATLTAFCFIFQILLEHNATLECDILISQFKSAIIFLMFEKNASLSHYTLNNLEVGKVINTLSSDLNILESKVPYFIYCIRVPILALGISAFLFSLGGWTVIIIQISLIMFFFLLNFLGKKEAQKLDCVNETKDKRIKLYSEIVDGIKFIKIYGWEIAFKKIIQELRQREVEYYLKSNFYQSLNLSFSFSSVYISIFLFFIVNEYLGQTGLTTATILAMLQGINALKAAMTDFGSGIAAYHSIHVILQRCAIVLNIQNIQMRQLHSEKMRQNIPVKESHEESQAYLQNFNGYWNSEGCSDLEESKCKQPALKDISLKLEKGKFYGITGNIGSGKSSLLSVFLQELPYYSGTCQINGSLAFVEQEPILFSSSIKNNIVFDFPFKREKYYDILNQARLTKDLEIMEKGDETQVGEKGTMMSGGQKARISFARALYADSDIILLDDPLSALDVKVGNQINEKGILPLKGKKTVLLVTHQKQFLMECDKIIILEDGQIKEFDAPENIKGLEMYYSQQDEKEQKMMKSEEHQGKQNQSEEKIWRQRVLSLDSEKIEIRFGSYLRYFLYEKKNYFLFPLTCLVFTIAQLSIAFYTRLISKYDQIKKGTDPTFDTLSQLWIISFFILLLYFLFIFLSNMLVNILVFNSNEAIHSDMIYRLVRSPLSYFDKVPSSQITNKFSNDLNILDTNLPFLTRFILERTIIFTVLLINIMQINKLMIPLSVVTFIGCWIVLVLMKGAILKIQHFNLESKTPIFHQMKELIDGSVQVRILGKRAKKIMDFGRSVNNELKTKLSFVHCFKMLGVIISYIIFVLLMFGFISGVESTISPELAALYGVQVVFLAQINTSFKSGLEKVTQSQNSLVSSERALIITKLESEKQLLTPYDKQKGIIEDMNEDKQKKEIELKEEKIDIRIKSLSLRYQENLPLVLSNINLSIADGERVGIVGRTGAGKSSLIQALLRLVEPEPGSVYQIGSSDALEMGLHTLRRNISVIPQTPFLTKGSIKENLDPFNEEREDRLWEVLEDSGLREKVENMKDGLETNITNVAESFSVGEKQLFCLARVMLNQNRILILDEATSNVDYDTDAFIQQCIRQTFSKCIIITIAHRLNTVADYDRVVVMDKGTIVEEGIPFELLKKNGHFHDMVNNTGKNKDIIWRMAEKAYRHQKH